MGSTLSNTRLLSSSNVRVLECQYIPSLSFLYPLTIPVRTRAQQMPLNLIQYIFSESTQYLEIPNPYGELHFQPWRSVALRTSLVFILSELGGFSNCSAWDISIYHLQNIIYCKRILFLLPFDTTGSTGNLNNR